MDDPGRNDLRLAALLCTRLCHDLVGPVGAISNGIELLGDTEAGLDDEVVALIGRSAQETTRRLRFFRAAYGLPGGGGGARDLASAAKLAAQFFAGGKIALDWDDGASAPLPVDEGICAQIILNLLLVGAETLPRGGRLAVQIAAADGGVTLSVIAEGSTIKLDDDLAARLEGRTTVAELDARRVQPLFAAQLAAACGGRLALALGGGDSIELSARIPQAFAAAD